MPAMPSVYNEVPGVVKHDLRVAGGLRVDGGLDLRGLRAVNLADPLSAQDAASKAYVDRALAAVPSASYTAGAGLTLSGSQFSLKPQAIYGNNYTGDGPLTGDVQTQTGIRNAAGQMFTLPAGPATLLGSNGPSFSNPTIGGIIVLTASPVDIWAGASGANAVTLHAASINLPATAFNNDVSGNNHILYQWGTITTAPSGAFSGYATLQGGNVYGTLQTVDQPNVALVGQLKDLYVYDPYFNAGGSGGWNAGQLGAPHASAFASMGGITESQLLSGAGSNPPQPLNMIHSLVGAVRIPYDPNAFGRGGSLDVGVGGVMHATGIAGFARTSGDANAIGVYGHAYIEGTGRYNDHAAWPCNLVLDDGGHMLMGAGANFPLVICELNCNIDGYSGKGTASENSVRGLSIAGNGSANVHDTANGRYSYAIFIDMESVGGLLKPFWTSPPGGQNISTLPYPDNINTPDTGGHWNYGLYFNPGSCNTAIQISPIQTYQYGVTSQLFVAQSRGPENQAWVAQQYNAASGDYVMQPNALGGGGRGLCPGGMNTASLGSPSAYWSIVYHTALMRDASRALTRDAVTVDPDNALALVRNVPIYRFRRALPAMDGGEVAHGADLWDVGYLAEDAPDLLRADDVNVSPAAVGGIALAAIQALAARVEALEQRV